MFPRLWSYKFWSFPYSFFIKPFSHITKIPELKFECLKNEKWFSGEIKSIFRSFWMAFSCQKLSQIWGCSFKNNFLKPTKSVFLNKFFWNIQLKPLHILRRKPYNKLYLSYKLRILAIQTDENGRKYIRHNENKKRLL